MAVSNCKYNETKRPKYIASQGCSVLINYSVAMGFFPAGVQDETLKDINTCLVRAFLVLI